MRNRVLQWSPACHHEQCRWLVGVSPGIVRPSLQVSPGAARRSPYTHL